MRIYPVVHIKHQTVAVEQALAAIDLGADGVYLIHHGGSVAAVLATFDQLISVVPDAFVGINLLGLSARDALAAVVQSIAAGVVRRAPDGLWCDDIRADRDPSAAMEVKRSSPNLERVLILGGIAFKYTPTFTEDPALAGAETRSLRDSVDVVTTSGAGTGTPPTVDKIRAMREVAERPLAVASGLSAENLPSFAGLVDEVLVASSVESAPYSGLFDHRRLDEVISLAHRL